MATKVQKKIGHDRMTFKATFDNSDTFTFNISRASDRYGASQLKTTAPISDADFKIITAWCRCGDNENHIQRYERAEAICMKAKSLEGLALLVSLEA